MEDTVLYVHSHLLFHQWLPAVRFCDAGWLAGRPAMLTKAADNVCKLLMHDSVKVKDRVHFDCIKKIPPSSSHFIIILFPKF